MNKLWYWLVATLLFSHIIETEMVLESTEKIMLQIRGIYRFFTGYASNKNIQKEVTFYSYLKTDKIKEIQIFVGNTSSLIEARFQPLRKTFIITHGYTDNKDRAIIVDLRNEILNRFKVNVIVVDWKNFASLIYFEVANAAACVGNYLGIFLKFLVSQGQDPNDIHLIGHSTGAHISGIAGALLGGSIGRITGLDVAGPLFEFIEKRGHNESLDPSDARFVDVIHTSAKTFGIQLPAGHVDFYPNGGFAPQPGCTNIFTSISCSHKLAVELFKESINVEVPLIGYKCKKVSENGLENCYGGEQAVMGFYTTNNNRGVYYVPTRSVKPYAKLVQLPSVFNVEDGSIIKVG